MALAQLSLYQSKNRQHHPPCRVGLGLGVEGVEVDAVVRGEGAGS